MPQQPQDPLSALEACINSNLSHLPPDARRTIFKQTKHSIKRAEEKIIKDTEAQILSLTSRLASARAAFQETWTTIPSTVPFLRTLTEKLKTPSYLESAPITTSIIKQEYRSFTHIVIEVDGEVLTAFEGVSLHYEEEKGYTLRLVVDDLGYLGSCGFERRFCFLPENVGKITYQSSPQWGAEGVVMEFRGSSLVGVSLRFRSQSDVWKFGERMELETGMEVELW